MGNWDSIEIKSTGKFLKVESDKPQTIRLIGDGSSRIVHGFGKDETSCSGNGCALCAEGSEAKQRFKANVYSFTQGKVFLWDFGGGIAKQLREIAKNLKTDGKTMDDVDLKISVSGSGLQKKYSIMPWPKQKELPAGLALYDIEIPF